MKLSKMRAKARSAFGQFRRVLYRDAAGILHSILYMTARPDESFVEVVIVRGRQFTKPQAARQRDG